MKKFAFALLFLAAAAVLTGCGPKKPADMPELYPCELTFTQDGQPAADVLVTLYPDGGDSKWRSGGTTDAQGKIKLRTMGKYDGVPAGKYKVTAFKTIVEAAEEVTEEMIKEGNTNVKTKETRYVDAKYEFPNDTPLSIEVAAGKNAETIDLGPAISETREVDPNKI